MKRHFFHGTGEKIFVNFISNDLISRICEELLQLTVKDKLPKYQKQKKSASDLK